MIDARLAIGVAIVLLTAAAAEAEPATTTSAVNLRSGASTDAAIVGRIPGGSMVDATGCREWCKVVWQGKQGFAIAASLNRGTRAAPRRAASPRDPYATDAAANSDVPMSAGTYQAPGRYYGPYFWSAGPASGPYKGTAGVGYRGRW